MPDRSHADDASGLTDGLGIRTAFVSEFKDRSRGAIRPAKVLSWL
jgi:hypothetical protein